MSPPLDGKPPIRRILSEYDAHFVIIESQNTTDRRFTVKRRWHLR